MKKGFFLALTGITIAANLCDGQTLLPPVDVSTKAKEAPKGDGKTLNDFISPPTCCTAECGTILSSCSPCNCADPAGPRFWVSADYLLWFVKNGPVNTPLVTTGSLNDFIPGAIGQPNTRVLFGSGNLNYNPLSGLRLQAGFQLADNLALEGGYLLLSQGAVHFTAAANANGDPLVARPVFNNQSGLNDSYGTSASGLWTGHSSVTSYSVLQGYEINLAATFLRTGRSRVDFLYGFRSLNLNEDLTIQDRLGALQPGILTFLGGPADPPSTLADFDRFRTSNNFYGGQIGGRWETFFDRFSVGLTGKIAFGVTQEQAIVDGATTLTTPTGSTTAPGGILAQPTNIGRYFRNQFAVVPEVGVNVKWRLTEHLRATLGYTMIYWSAVARPGNQIDHSVNPSLVPTDQNFGNGLGVNRPAFAFHSSDFWAQGINLGLEFNY